MYEESLICGVTVELDIEPEFIDGKVVLGTTFRAYCPMGFDLDFIDKELFTIEDLEKIISFFGDCKNKEVKENKLITTYRNVDFEFEDWEEDGFAINWLMSYSEETDSYYLDFPMEEIEVDDFYYYLQDVYKDAKVLKEKIEK